MIELCPICNRELPDNYEEHHLIPKTFKGKELIKIHPVCHRKLHATFSEREMQKYYNTIERLLEHEDIKTFVEWVKNKPIDFYIKTKDSNTRKSKRRK